MDSTQLAHVGEHRADNPHGLVRLQHWVLFALLLMTSGCAWVQSLTAVSSQKQDLPALTDEELKCGHCAIYIAKGTPMVDPQLMFAVCKEPSRLELDLMTGALEEKACHVLWPPITANQASSFQLGTIGSLINSANLSIPVTPQP